VLQDRRRFPVSLGMVRVAWLCLVRSVRVWLCGDGSTGGGGNTGRLRCGGALGSRVSGVKSLGMTIIGRT
jgi:hypothetical protein